ncbi:16374_t:CDS:2, partial [Racocetra fulgida]
MGDDYDDFSNRHANAEIVGSAPVGNSKWSALGNRKWSALKRKKINIESSHSKEFASDEFKTASKNLSLDNLMPHNFNHNENMLSIEKSNESFKFGAMVSNGNSVPLLSPRTSLLTMAFNAKSQNAQATKVDSYFDVSTINSSHTCANDENIPFSESSEASSKSPLSKSLENNLPQINHNSFTPKFSSPLAISTPITASSDDHDVIQNAKNAKNDVNVEEFTNLGSENIRDEQKNVNNQNAYNRQTSPEITNPSLPPIKEELSKSHQNSLHPVVKNTVLDSPICVKSTHSREPSNSLQNLFINPAAELSSENISEKTKVMDQTSDNCSYDDINQRETILSGKFSLAVKKSWNNEFIEAEEILMRRKDGIPRWSVAFAEVQLVKHLMTGQAAEYQDPELTNSLSEAEKLANKETTLAMFIKDVWKTDIKPANTPSEDEAELASLRLNYRWDCELAMADILLFRSVLQVIGGNEIKGALNLHRAWKLYSKVKDEVDRIKGELNKNTHKKEPNSSNNNNGNLWGFMGISNMVKFGVPTQEKSGVHDTVNSIKVDPDIEDCL